MRSDFKFRLRARMNGTTEQWPSRLMALPMIALLLLAMTALGPASTASAQSSNPIPIVGEIVVDRYDCGAELLYFHVPVTNLPSVPEGTSGFDFPLAYSFTSFYEAGMPINPTLFLVYNPPPAPSTFTGDVFLQVEIPSRSTSGIQPETGPFTSIELYVSVGYGGSPGFGAGDNPTDTTTTTYAVDCDDGGSTDGGFVAQLVAALKRVLSQILNR